jgi:hypothetical protein
VRKLLIPWSGRRGSNPRRPAWENDSKLKTQNDCVYGILVLAIEDTEFSF